MSDLESYKQEAHRAVADTAQAFHLQATTNEGLAVAVPVTYQILEPGFRPFRAAKASAGELQQVLDDTVAEAETKGIDLGIEGQESLRKLAIQLGLGIDCSNFVYRSLELLHDRLGLGAYTETVYREAAEIKALHDKKGNWRAKDENGNDRELTEDEARILETQDSVSVRWVTDTFGKDPEFILGSKHIAAAEATVPIASVDVAPGDIIAFNKAVSGVVSHVAIVESVEETRFARTAQFWHSWHSRDFQSGLRRDYVTFGEEVAVWSHEDLADASRYRGHTLVRPVALASVYDSGR